MKKLYAVLALMVSVVCWGFCVGAQPSKDSPAAAASKAPAKTKTTKSKNTAASSKAPAASAQAATKSSAKPAAAGAAPAPATGQAPARPPPPASASVGAGAKPAGKSKEEEAAARYVVRLRDLESRVDELKEQIRRSHTRLTLLSESVLAAGVGGAQAQIVFRNAMSNAFRVEEVMVVLDGAVQYNEKGDEAPHRRQQVTPVFDGAIPPGDHTIQIVVTLRGHGYGVFSYLKGYSFEAKSTHSFTVRQGGSVRIEAISYERGDATTPLDQKPALRFKERPLVASEQAAQP
jgi:hypothetical protein